MTDTAKILQPISSKFRHVQTDNNLKWSVERQHAVAVINKSKDLKQCTPDSLGAAVLQAASMGLSLNPIMQHCYLIPRRERGKKQGESWEQYNKANVPFIATATPSYRGMAHLAVKSGAVLDIAAEIVFQADLFEYYGPTEKPLYQLNIKGSHLEKDALFVFAIARLQNDLVRSAYMDRDTVQRIRKMSEVPNGIMWHPEKMWTEGYKKAIIKRMFKTLPINSPSLVNAIDLSNNHDGAIIEGEKAEQIECITEEQSLTLHAMLTDQSFDENKINSWLNRLAERFGVNSFEDIPRRDFDDAKKTLEIALDE